MIETALIDGDIVCYRTAAAYEQEEQELAEWQAGEMMRRILHETNAAQFKCFLTGSDNFRYIVNPEYKANRRDAVRPRHLESVREYLVSAWKATVTDGVEADDALGIEQCAEEDTVICSIDKDLLMIPGRHYNFVKQEHRMVSPLEGIRHFYFQLIMGDRSDNIFGYDGKARQKVPKFLEPVVEELNSYVDEQDMYHMVRNMYDDVERMHMNAKCLWIWRKENDLWVPPDERMDRSPPEELHHINTESREQTLPP